MTSRLSKSDWLDFGLQTLVSLGVDGLKATPLAERLNVTRGSFYWHFTDVKHFRTELIAHWRKRSTTEVIKVNELGAGVDRLQLLLERAFANEVPMERAVRAWALQDNEVADAVGEVDSERLSYIEELLTLRGVEKSEARPRALLLYWAYIGQQVATTQDCPSSDKISIALIERVILGH